MMTPDQRIQEVDLLLKNLDYDGFNVQNLLDLLDVLNRAEVIIGHKIRTAHSACGTSND